MVNQTIFINSAIDCVLRLSFLFDVNLVKKLVTTLVPSSDTPCSVSMVTSELAILKKQLIYIKQRDCVKKPFPGKEVGFAALSSSTSNQVGMRVSYKVTEGFKTYFKMLNALLSPSMVEKHPLLWLRKNAKEKLSKCDLMKSTIASLCKRICGS